MNWFDRSLCDLARKLTGAKVGIVGDLVADFYIFGRTKRVSREAPVLILEYEKDHIIPGGAANAVYNLAALGAIPMPVGVIGADEDGEKLLDILEQAQVSTDLVVTDPARPTTIKKRVLGSGLHTTYQQMLRIDQGWTTPVNGDVEQKLLDQIHALAEKCDVLVVSDYGYGVFSDRVLEGINALAKKGDLPVLVDSRYSLNRFLHPALVTPNEPEAEAAAGLRIREDADVVVAAQKIMETTRAQAVCITRGKRGMYLLQRDSEGVMLPIFGSDEIADVTGAGDTVMAVFAASMAAGLSLLDAARLATVAGGLVVMKAGTATVTISEICAAVEETSGG